MYMFDNLVILSDFKLQKKLALPKNPCRIYVLRLSFCTLMLHQFSKNCFPFYACKTGAFCTGFVCVLRCCLLKTMSSPFCACAWFVYIFLF